MRHARRLAAVVALLAAAVALGAVLRGSDRLPSVVPQAPPAPPAPGAVALHAAATPAPAHAAEARPRPRLPRGTDARAALRRALLTGAITRAQWTAWHRDLVHARRATGRLDGARAGELRSVLASVEGLAASGRLTASRMPLAFLTLHRNTSVWRLRRFPAAGERMTFGRDPAVFQYFPGRGVQFHALATAGQANALAAPCVKVAARREARGLARARRRAALRLLGLASRPRTVALRWRGCHPRTLARRLDRLVALASSRGGFRAWEYRFAYGGGSAPWVSAMTQATAAQALARGAAALGRPQYRTAALGALGAFEVAPPVGVRLRGGPYAMYSFAPGLRILNGELQSVIGLYDVAQLTGSRRARALYRLGEGATRREVAAYDTGAWSRYSYAGRESTLAYHELVTSFLAGLCSRTSRAVYCDRAARFDRYLHEPPRIELSIPLPLREERPAAFTTWVSKVSSARVTVTDRRGVVLDRSAQLPRGRYRYAFTPPRPGRYTVRVTATGPEGKRAVAKAQVRARPEPKPKPKQHPQRRRHTDVARPLPPLTR